MIYLELVMKKFLLLSVLAASAAFGGDVTYKVESMKMEGFYSVGGILKGTEKSMRENSNIPAQKGWNEIKAFNIHNKPEALYDGLKNYKGYISTYAWSAHRKRIEVVIDVQSQQYVEKIAIWNNTSNQIETVDISFAVEDQNGKIVWSKAEQFVPEFAPEVGKKIIPLYYPVKKDVRKIKILCTNRKPLCLAIFELEVFKK